MLSCRVILDVPLPLVVFVSDLLVAHRRQIGIRNGTCPDLVEVGGLCAGLFGDRPDIRLLSQGAGISQATRTGTRTRPSRSSPRRRLLREALEKAAEQGLPHVILDGALISSDRCADKKTSRKGGEIDKWHSGKAHEPGNVKALAAQRGVPLCGSDVRPGSTHDLTGARELVLPRGPSLPERPAHPGRLRA